MGRSNSCFKIITCGSDSADKDDVEAPEVKGDKKGWSFRKRSARHRVLNNTVVSEASPLPPPPESAISSDVPEKVFDVPEKVPDVLENVPEKVPDVLENVPEKVPDVLENVPEKVPDVLENVPEKVSYVNETVLVPQSTEEKPQASAASEDSKTSDPDPVVVDAASEVIVDSELEQSAATVIQTSVRGVLAQRELVKHKNVIKLQAAVRGHLVRSHAVGTLRCVQAIVKMQLLVRARRARMSGSVDESGSDQKQDKDKKNKPTPTYISIDKLLSNRFARRLLESTPKEKPIHMKCEISESNSAWNWLERWMSASAAAPSPAPSPYPEPVTHQHNKTEKDETHEAETENPPETLSISVDLPSVVEEDNLITDGADSIKICERRLEDVGTSEEQDSPLELSSEVEAEEEPKRSMKRSASEELVNDVKKSTAGSKKATNPAFIAAQSRFEELGSSAAMPENDLVAEEKELKSSRALVVESECGTELSISSTLDSPDRFYGGPVEVENTTKVTEEEADSTVAPEVKPETLESDLHGEVESETVQQESSYVVSPEHSHMTVLESQGTPASQASVNTVKGSRSGPSHKRKSLSTNKRSPSHPNNESGSSSAKQSGKDEKSSKRRSSSTKSENVDHEQNRDSSSSSSVPHFMQATKSAKAKINASNSPRSSPDVQDNRGGEVHVKKRLSLPGANGRQGSPRIERPTPQTQQGVKVNGTAVQERKWLR